MLNFTWWVNRKDRAGRNVFEGGFLGPGQHRRVRPQRAIAHRRMPGAGRWHGVDGAILPETCWRSAWRWAVDDGYDDLEH
jgi:hypothetical protein